MNRTGWSTSIWTEQGGAQADGQNRVEYKRHVCFATFWYGCSGKTQKERKNRKEVT